MRVTVVDDDTLVAVSLKTILEAEEGITVDGIGVNGKDAIQLYEEKKPDILLMDIRMDGISGLEAADRILDTDPNAKILFLTTFSDDAYIVKALAIGAKGYILKQDFEGIVPALKAVLGGQSVFGSDIAGKIPTLMHTPEQFDYAEYGIGKKELEIIEAVALGLSNKEIADKLFLSEGTVRNYVSVILEKLSLRDRTQLAIFYYRHETMPYGRPNLTFHNKND